MYTNKWILSTYIIFLAVLPMLLSGCDEGIPGNGNTIKEERDVKDFSEIRVGDAFKVILTQGSEEKLVIEADDNLMKYITARVSGSTLVIDTRERIEHSSMLVAHITFKDLKYMDLSGACELINRDTISLQELRIEGSGASQLDMTMNLEKLILDLSGASEIDLAGSASNFDANLSGAADLTADDFMAENVRIDISGAGTARVYATVELDARVSGAASVRYKGNPKVTQDVSGAGSVSPL